MRDKIIELYGNHTENGLLFADGLDDAIIGICPDTLRVVYSRTKVIEIFIKDDFMTEDDAIEYFDYNVIGSWVGEDTPIYINQHTILNIEDYLEDQDES